MGASGLLPEPRSAVLSCDVLQVRYAQALLEGNEAQFLADLRAELEPAAHVTVRNSGLLRGDVRDVFEDLFRQCQARGKRLERRD